MHTGTRIGMLPTSKFPPFFKMLPGGFPSHKFVPLETLKKFLIISINMLQPKGGATQQMFLRNWNKRLAKLFSR
jgi:hypothetical protein